MAWFRNMGGIPFEPAVLSLVNAQRKVFEDLGCVIEEAEPDWTGAHDGYDILRAWNYAATEAENVRLHGDLVGDLVKDTLHWQVEHGSKLTGGDIAHAHSLRSAAWDRMRAVQQKYDLTNPIPRRSTGPGCRRT